MTDAEVDDLLVEIEAILSRGYLLARAEAAMHRALNCIRVLRAQRDATQGFPIDQHPEGDHPGTKSV